MRFLESFAILPLIVTPFTFAADSYYARAPSNLCQYPEIKPLISSIANNFPKSAVNSFCSSVVGKNGQPKTTTTVQVRTTVVETVIDTYSATATKCVTSLAGRDALPIAEAAPTPPPSLKRDGKGGLFGFPAAIVTKACQCVLPTSTQTVTRFSGTSTSYIFGETTVTSTSTVTVRKPLPTFKARILAPGTPEINNYYLQVSAAQDDRGEVFAYVAVAEQQKSLASVFSITCEGYLLQQNTTSQGENRRIATHSFAIFQAPIYFDPQSQTDFQQSGAGERPLFCNVDATNKLRCYAIEPTQNQFQHCPNYAEFFSTTILLTTNQGSDCQVFEVAVEPV